MAAARRTKKKAPEVPGTASADEVARFTAMAEEWWDPHGKFRPLHDLNPPRVDFIRTHLARHFGKSLGAGRPFEGLAVLDVGCGGGLLSEPLSRLGAKVVGIDAGEANVQVARIHAEGEGLAIDYRQGLPEELAVEGKLYDAVLVMEVVEHVPDVDALLQACARLVRPGGVMVLSTVNRTLKAFALAKVAAEYILRWLPAGTHDWNKFLRPSELAAALARQGLDVIDLKGMGYNPLAGAWYLTADLDVNYLVLATKG
ncbi:MAG: bifunctional 2-polyprenyl-6-hydroxyphenol methylase/3-demethylubiquinol 3-O-methyltransferase UbiG [Magnetospirillum sp. WYHS-4]